jgi:hypothetical protein
MKYETAISDLEAFAKGKIAAERYPNDYHFFTLFKCDGCGVAPFELVIEHHTGSKEGNFKGMILGQCVKCGSNKRVFSFTGDHRKRMQKVKPVCKCGAEGFLVGECERVEGEEGVMGFFDEGVVVGKCTDCGQNQVFVYTD